MTTLFKIPLQRINWITSSFLISTALLTLTAVPAYLWFYGLDAFQAGMFFFFWLATGLSITLGYHRLFSHLSFRAKWPVKLFTLVFGAAAFENSALDWCSDHRRHHKHVDHDDDPYDITKGFFHAHIGWLLFKLRPEPPLDNVADLQRDALVLWQHRWCHLIGISVGFLLPTLLGFWWGGAQGALGGFLIAGVARVTVVQQMTFCINSLCHTFGRRPYSTKCSARDSGVMALFTFGEGYHNYHHEFQHDYRNGVKPWQFDPTKWTIWALQKVGLVSELRRAQPEKILLAEIAEARRQIENCLNSPKFNLPDNARALLQASHDKLHELAATWTERKDEYLRASGRKLDHSREVFAEMRRELRVAIDRLEELTRPAPATL